VDEEGEELRESFLVAFTEDGRIRRADLKVRIPNPKFVIRCESGQKVIVFTDSGKAYWIDPKDLPRELTSLGKILNLSRGEKAVSAVPIDEFADDEFVVILTRDGYIKKTRLSEFANAKKSGVIASAGEIALARIYREGEVVIGTKMGYVVRFRSDEVPEKGRNAKGVKAVNLRAEDEVAWMTMGRGKEVLILTREGTGKRTDVEEFRLTSRGAMGVSGGRGTIVFMEFVKGNEDVVVLKRNGDMIRINVSKIPKIPRNKKGIHICDDIACATVLE